MERLLLRGNSGGEGLVFGREALVDFSDVKSCGSRLDDRMGEDVSVREGCDDDFVIKQVVLEGAKACKVVRHVLLDIGGEEETVDPGNNEVVVVDENACKKHVLFVDARGEDVDDLRGVVVRLGGEEGAEVARVLLAATPDDVEDWADRLFDKGLEVLFMLLAP